MLSETSIRLPSLCDFIFCQFVFTFQSICMRNVRRFQGCRAGLTYRVEYKTNLTVTPLEFGISPKFGLWSLEFSLPTHPRIPQALVESPSYSGGAAESAARTSCANRLRHDQAERRAAGLRRRTAADPPDSRARSNQNPRFHTCA